MAENNQDLIDLAVNEEVIELMEVNEEVGDFFDLEIENDRENEEAEGDELDPEDDPNDEPDLLDELDFGQDEEEEVERAFTAEQVRRQFMVEHDAKISKTIEALENGVRPGELYELLKEMPKFANALDIRDVHEWAENLRSLTKTIERFDRAIFVRDDRQVKIADNLTGIIK
jgi:hypothetical protein